MLNKIASGRTITRIMVAASEIMMPLFQKELGLVLSSISIFLSFVTEKKANPLLLVLD